MLTTREGRDGGYVLNGTKRWITNGYVAHVALVWAKLERQESTASSCRRRRRASPPREIHGKWSLRASVTSELHPRGRRRRRGRAAARRRGHARRRCRACRRRASASAAARSARRWRATTRARRTQKIAFSSRSRSPATSSCSAKLVDDGHRDHEGAAALPAARPPQGSRQACGPARSRSRSATTSRSRSTSPATRATSSARTASPTSIPIVRHMLNLETVYTYEGTHDIHRSSSARTSPA